MRTVVCRKDELLPGSVTGAQVGPIRIAVVRARDGSLHALAGKCLHQGGPLELGPTYAHHATTDDVGEYVVDGDTDVLKCPWHGYEYDVRTGRTVFDENRCLPRFAVHEDGEIGRAHV